ncbi:hypothetical protein [Nonomuraea recticatena]|uniref:hypothetical protein n=1 Tax=Nonomuraea recticatena TaxID=46178 RepID=UPI00360D5ACE
MDVLRIASRQAEAGDAAALPGGRASCGISAPAALAVSRRPPRVSASLAAMASTPAAATRSRAAPSAETAG